MVGCIVCTPARTLFRHQVSLYPTPVGNPVAQPLQAPAGRRYSSIEEPDVLPITE